MPLVWKDRIKVASATTGTGTLTLGAAASGYQTFASGDNGKMYAYVIEDGTAWETGYGVYTHSGTTFARTTRTDSSTGSAISCTGSEFLFVDLTAAAAALSLLPIDSASPVSVTGTTTATLGKLHIVSGTSVNYTVTLPPGPSSATPSNCLGFIFAEALTKIVTLDGDGSETINAALTRKQRNGETTYLRWDGAEWVKIAGVSRPMYCRIKRTTDQSLTTGAYTLCTLDTFVSGIAAMHNGSTVDIIRPGDYLAVGEGYANGLTAAGFFAVGKSSVDIGHQMAIQGGGIQGYFARVFEACVAADQITLFVYGDNAPVLKGSVLPASLHVTEQVAW